MSPVKRMPPSAMTDARAAQRLRDFHHRAELGNADARNHTRRADRARSYADFNGVGSGLHQGLGGIGGGDVATDHVNGREGGLDFLQCFEYAAAVAVRRVDDDRVDPALTSASVRSWCRA